MNIKSWGVILFFIIFLFQTFDNQAQIIQKSYTIEWKDNLIFSPDENSTTELLYFKNAISDEVYPSLPLFFEKNRVDNFFRITNIQSAIFSFHRFQKANPNLSLKILIRLN